MNFVCKSCNYYLEANGLQFCGLGYNPVTISKCDKKEEKQKHKTPIKLCSKLDYLYPIGKGVEQAPSWIHKPVYYFSRYHKTNKDKKTRKVSIIFIVDKEYTLPRQKLSYKEYNQELYYDKRIYTITWDEFIRESFLSRRKRAHRHTIK